MLKLGASKLKDYDVGLLGRKKKMKKKGMRLLPSVPEVKL